MRLLLFLFLILFGVLNSAFLFANKTKKERLLEEEARLAPEIEEIAAFYHLPEGVQIQEITGNVLVSSQVRAKSKEEIQAFGRRIFVFNYPSDGLKVKGLISFIPDPKDKPTIFFLRGGNRLLGVLSPGMDLVSSGKYTVLASMYRGGVSEGQDEFGGGDVNDVKNLIDYIPELERQLNIQIQSEKMFLIGASRGGMQMFLTLGRFPELQSRFLKMVSLSGLVDIRQCIQEREDMQEMLEEDFGLEMGVNEEEWIEKRDPLSTVENISSDLPILIIQGTKDERVSLEQGYRMVSKLEAAGKNVTYLEVEGGKHCLSNRADRADLIFTWFES